VFAERWPDNSPTVGWDHCPDQAESGSGGTTVPSYPGFLIVGRNKVAKSCRNSANAVKPYHTLSAHRAEKERPKFRHGWRLLVPADQVLRNPGYWYELTCRSPYPPA
jgi:hypothetical protein